MMQIDLKNKGIILINGLLPLRYTQGAKTVARIQPFTLYSPWRLQYAYT